MTDEYEEKAPGVTLWLETSTLSDMRGTTSKTAKLELRGEVRDDALWNMLEAKFQKGFRVYSEPDFHIEVIDAMRLRIKELEERALLAERDARREKDAKELALQEVERYKAPLAAFGRALRG